MLNYIRTMISSSFQFFPRMELRPFRRCQVLEERDFDGALKGIEDAADRVDETAPGSVQKKAKDGGRQGIITIVIHDYTYIYVYI